MDQNPADQRTELEGQDAFAKVRELLPKFQTAMLVTHTSDGSVHARPMGLQGDVSTFGGVLWFFTDIRSRKVSESAGNAAVSVICQSDQENAYLHLVGTATLTRDMAKMRELFTPLVRTWFPDGLEDPNLALIKFEASEGSYWESAGGMLRVMMAFAKAVVTRRPAQGGDVGNLTLAP